MNIGSLFGFGSGRSFSIGHLNIFFYICFSIGSGSGQTIFKFPNFAKPYPLYAILANPSTHRQIEIPENRKKSKARKSKSE
jgi:hypothetical protein